MEIIFGICLGVLFTILGACVGMYLATPKRTENIDILKNRERQALCRILNNRKDILVRFKNCETTTYYAHVATHKDTEEYIMIDLD